MPKRPALDMGLPAGGQQSFVGQAAGFRLIDVVDHACAASPCRLDSRWQALEAMGMDNVRLKCRDRLREGRGVECVLYERRDRGFDLADKIGGPRWIDGSGYRRAKAMPITKPHISHARLGFFSGEQLASQAKDRYGVAEGHEALGLPHHPRAGTSDAGGKHGNAK
jgi:hypothetical protein